MCRSFIVVWVSWTVLAGWLAQRTFAAEPPPPAGFKEQVASFLQAHCVRCHGATKQSGDLADMIWSAAEQVSYLSVYFTLQPGDLIFSGTPEGVGPVARGQTMVGAIGGLGEIRLRVT